MSISLLYWLLLQGTATSFAGLTSLPVIQEALVNQHHVLSMAQLNEAVALSRSTPGPMGLYVVSVGYFVAGVPGAICGWLAMITPALFIMPLLYFVGRAIDHPRISAVLQSIVIASAGLLLASAVPLARSGLTDPVTWGIALASLALLFGTKLDTLWIVLGGAAAALTARGLLLLAALG